MRIDYRRFTHSRGALAIIAGIMLLFLGLPSAAAQAPGLEIRVEVQELAAPGSNVAIFITTTLGGSLVDATVSAHVWRPDFTPPPTSLPTPRRFVTGHYNTTYAIPADAESGLYAVHVRANVSTTVNFSTGHIKVTLGDPDHLDDFLHQTFVKLDALEGFLVDFRTLAGGHLTEISDDIAALSTSLTAATSDISGLRSDISTLSGTVGGVSTAVGGVKSDTSAIRSDVSAGVGSLTTLVYAAIALTIITLILEVVVLTRKR